MNIASYPLTWPAGWKRFAEVQRREAPFGRARQIQGTNYVPARKLTMNEAIERVLEELSRMGVERHNIVMSTNVPARLDGMPKGGMPRPADPGAAVYWYDGGGKTAPRVMAIDRYDRVEDNMAAIAATIQAMRAIERHGGALILERAFSGFLALPAPATKTWRDVLGLAGDVGSITAEALRGAYRVAASAAHPDKVGTGNSERMAAVNVAYDQARQELGL